MAQHNPIPWKWEPETDTIRTQKENYWIATLDSWDGMVKPNRDANGQFIVLAVNCHAALVAALEALIPPPATSYHGLNKDCPHARLYGGPCPGHSVPDDPKITAAKAAIQAAKEEA